MPIPKDDVVAPGKWTPAKSSSSSKPPSSKYDQAYWDAIKAREQSFKRWYEQLQQAFPPSQYQIILGGRGGYDTKVRRLDSGGGSGGGGGAPQPVKITWKAAYTIEGAPSWWKGLVPSTNTPEAEYAMLINAMIPFMSPEDQVYMGSYLARLFPDAFGDYEKTMREQTKIPSPPQLRTDVTTNPATGEFNPYDIFQSSRGSKMADALERMRSAAGIAPDKMGAGYRFLHSLARDIEVYGARAGENITRANLAKLYGQFDQKLGETQAGALQGYGELARAIVNPFFSAGKAFQVMKDESGNYRFGYRNPRWQ